MVSTCSCCAVLTGVHGSEEYSGPKWWEAWDQPEEEATRKRQRSDPADAEAGQRSAQQLRALHALPMQVWCHNRQGGSPCAGREGIVRLPRMLHAPYGAPQVNVTGLPDAWPGMRCPAQAVRMLG